MADQQPSGRYGGGRNWLKYVIVYLVVGGAVYAAIYFLMGSYGD